MLSSSKGRSKTLRFNACFRQFQACPTKGQNSCHAPCTVGLGSIRPRQILHHRLAAPEPAHLLLVLALLMMLMRNSAIRLLERLMAARSWMLHLPVMAARSWILQRLMAARSWILHLPLGLHELQVPPVAAPNPKESPVALGEEVARAEEARRTHPGTPSAALNDAARGRPWAELRAFKPIA